MSIKRICSKFCLTVFLLFVFYCGEAASGPGSCKDFDFPLDQKGMIDRTAPVTVIRHGSPVYKDAEGLAVISPPLILNFSKKLKPLKAEGGRVQVGNLGGGSPLGWVKSSDLLCAVIPLKATSGLEKKLYIKTATAVRGDLKVVNAYAGPEDLECPEAGCRELSRFTGYFIFDEENDRFLLGDEYYFKEARPLTGWVNKNDGFVWETALGIRPKENLSFPEGHKKAGQERAVCAYLSIEDAKAEEGCRPILGGSRWFRYPDRIPILSREEGFYKVALPLAGTGGVEGKKGSDKLKISPELFGENPGINKGLSNMKKIDVFFLIDGTSSMQPYIDAAQGVVKLVLDTLSTDESYEETKFRFGFRIYRDTYAGIKNLGDGFPLSSDCEVIDDEKMVKNRFEFEKAISGIKVSKNDRDDYEENVFGGIKQAIKDINPCTDNTKILFIIGDHGYSAEAQDRHGDKPVKETYLVNRLKGDGKEGVKNIVTFFIQTPDHRKKVKNSDAYGRAYDLFHKQAKNLLEGILKKYKLEAEEIKNFLLTTDDSGLPEKILSGVSKFSRADVINEIILDLRGGASLVDAITRLQGNSEYGNLPGLFWDVLKDGTCKHLGEQCTNKKFDTILEGYIPVSEDIVEDVWLKSDDLEKWKRILSLMAEIFKAGNISGTKQRRAIVVTLTAALQKVLGDRRILDNSDKAIREYLMRIGGLPVRENSPMFNYSMDRLKDRERVPDCEISRLGTWIINVKQMLDIVSLGTKRPVFTFLKYPGECTRPDGSPISIPFISGSVKQANLGPGEKFRYDHAFQKVRIYWVPKEYLP